MMRNLWIKRGLWAFGVTALLWALWPAWSLWQTHPAQMQQLAQQRQAMQAAQQEAQALNKKTIPTPTEAQAQLVSLARQHFGSTPVVVAGQGIQVELRGVSAAQLAQGWSEIRTQTSASVVRTDLSANGGLWSGTLVFKLAQKP